MLQKLKTHLLFKQMRSKNLFHKAILEEVWFNNELQEFFVRYEIKKYQYLNSSVANCRRWHIVNCWLILVFHSLFLQKVWLRCVLSSSYYRNADLLSNQRSAKIKLLYFENALPIYTLISNYYNINDLIID